MQLLQDAGTNEQLQGFQDHGVAFLGSRCSKTTQLSLGK